MRNNALPDRTFYILKELRLCLLQRLHRLILSFRRRIVHTKLTPLDCFRIAKKENSSKDLQFNFGFKSRTSFKSTKRLHALAFISDTVEIKCQFLGSGIGNEAYKFRCTRFAAR